jgi:hypothetical protein
MGRRVKWVVARGKLGGRGDSQQKQCADAGDEKGREEETWRRMMNTTESI